MWSESKSILLGVLVVVEMTGGYSWLGGCLVLSSFNVQPVVVADQFGEVVIVFGVSEEVDEDTSCESSEDSQGQSQAEHCKVVG